MASKIITKGLKRTALSIALGMCFAGAAHAQSNTAGSVSGQAVAGDIIVIENPTTGFRREITADANGAFRAGALTIGTYYISRGTDKRAVTVSVGTSANVNFATTTTTLEGVVVIGASINPIDVASVESATIITAEVLGRLPINRNVTSVALLAPGTTQGDSAFGNLASFGGSTVGENAYYINGFNVTNFRSGLGFSNVPFEMYEEFQIKTGGYGAEFGRSTGGVVNAVTKSGSNEFHFGVNAFWAPEGLQGQSPDVYDNNGSLTISNSKDRAEQVNANVYASGAIVKDRLFFYAIGSYRDNTGDNVNAFGVSTRNVSDNPFYGLKLDWLITDNHRLEYTGFRDTNENTGTAFRTYTPTDQGDPQGYVGPIGNATKQGGDNHILKYTGYLTDSFTLSALAGEGNYEISSGNGGASASPECFSVTFEPIYAAARQLGCATTSLDSFNNKDQRRAYRIDAEWDLGDLFLGSHFLRFGVDQETNSSSQETIISNGNPFRYRIVQRNLAGDGIDTDYDGVDDTFFPRGRWRVIRDFYDNVGEFETISEAFYIEDQWRPTENLLLTLGVRNESFDNKNAEGNSFIKIDDQLAPRLGFAWDVNSDSSFKVFGNYGRYYLPVANNTNVRLAGAEEYRRSRYNWVIPNDGSGGPVFNPDGSQILGAFNPDGSPVLGAFQFGSVFASGAVLPTTSTVDQAIEPMYQDEYILGFQHALGKNWTVGVRLAYRDLKSAIEDSAVDAGLNQYIIDNNIAPSRDCDYDHVNESFACGFDYYVLTNPGRPVTAFFDIDADGDLDEVTLTPEQLGYEESVRRYKAVEFFFERAWDEKWFLQGSYTWSQSYGNNEGFVRSDNGQTDSGLTTLFDQPGLGDGSFGYLPNDRRHTIKVFGAYQLTSEFQVNTNVNIRSGRPINCFGNHPTDAFAFQYDTESFYCDGKLVQRGSLGRTPWVYNFDVGMSYRPAFAGDKLGFRLDVTNVFGEATPTEVYEVGELAFDVGSVDPNFLTPEAFQAPRTVRLAVSYDW